MEFGDNLKRARKAFNMTQDEFSKKIGISRSYLGDLEKNRRNPSTKTVKTISDKLGISVFFLMTGLPNEKDGRVLNISPVLHDTEEFRETLSRSVKESIIDRLNSNQFDKNELLNMDDFIILQDYLKNTPDFIGYDFVKNTLNLVYITRYFIETLNKLDSNDSLNFSEYFIDAQMQVNDLQKYLNENLNELNDLDAYIWDEKDKFDEKKDR